MAKKAGLREAGASRAKSKSRSHHGRSASQKEFRAPFASGSQSDERLNRLLVLYRRVDALLKKYAFRADWIDTTILILSVLTSGALWLLASQVISQQITWVGAVISTAITGLTIYLYASGLNAKRKKAHQLYVEIGKYIADYRSKTDSAADNYWAKVKYFEGQMRRIEYGRDD